MNTCIIQLDVQEYIVDILTNNSIRYDMLKYRIICKHWKKYIDNQLLKLKNDDLNNYFLAMRICNQLPKDSINFKKMIIIYVFASPNNKEIKYKCSKCGRFKLILGDYECCKEKYLIYIDSFANIVNIIYIILFYIIYINIISYILIHTINYVILKMYNVIDILKIIIVLL